MDFAEGMPTAVVQLDKPREIGFTLGAMRRVNEKLGTLDFNPDAPDAVLALPTYIWACLPTTARAELSIEQIGDLIHPGNMEAISNALAALFRGSMPDAKENPTTAVPPEAAVPPR